LINVEDKVATVKEVFRLQDEKELAEAEKKYMWGIWLKCSNILFLKYKYSLCISYLKFLFLGVSFYKCKIYFISIII